MNFLDVAIIFIILITALLGLKRGVFKEIVIFIGTILIFIIAYKLKNIVGDFMVINFPFIDFPDFLKGITAFNIVLYQSLAFIIVSVVLFAIYELVLSLTGIFEKLLKFTIILGIPSRILGFIVGLIEGYIIAFLLVFLVSQPVFKFDFVENSEYSSFILNKSPLLTNITKDTTDIVKEVISLSKQSDKNEVNLELVNLILKDKVTSVDVIEKLVNKGKLNVKDIDSVINKYK